MRINHKLLRHARIKLAITPRSIIQTDHLDTHYVGDLDAVPHDRLHQLAVVFHDRGLAGVEAVGFGPAQAEANAQAAHFGGGVNGSRVFGDVQAGDADLAGDAHYAHQRVEHGGGCFGLSASMAVTACFEAYGVDGAIHFRFAEQGSDLLVQGGVLGQVGNFEALGLGVNQTRRVHVADDHHGSAQQAC